MSTTSNVPVSFYLSTLNGATYIIIENYAYPNYRAGMISSGDWRSWAMGSIPFIDIIL